MKTNRRSAAKRALGVLVDGRDLRIAHLSRQGGQIKVLSLESVTLPRRLGADDSSPSPALALHDAHGKDAFGFTGPLLPFNGLDEGSGDEISATLISTFSKYPLNEVKFAVNAPESQVAYHNFESDFKLKGKKLEKRLREEIGPLSGSSLTSNQVGYFKSSSDNLTALALEGSVPLINELLEVKTFLPGGAPYFSLVQSNELALINLARSTLNLDKETVSALIYIGYDFSRVVILKGDQPLSFVQTIHEGYNSPEVCQTIFSKILLEQEEAGLSEIENIILAGEVGLTHAYEFFSKQFPEAKVQFIAPGPLNTNSLKPEELAVFPNYAIPVALAWQALESKHDNFIATDLLPPDIKEAQQFFKVAWHGFALLGFVFISVALLSYQGLSRWYSIRELQESIQVKQQSIVSLGTQLNYARQMQTQIGNYNANLKFLNSLIVDPGKWSRLFEKLSSDFQSVNRIWVEKVKSEPQGFTMVGKALARDRIPELADGFTGVDLKRVTRVISGGGETSYEFEMNAFQPPPQPIPVTSAASGKGTVVNASNQVPENSNKSIHEGR